MSAPPATPTPPASPLLRSTSLLGTTGVLLTGVLALTQPLPPAIPAAPLSPAGAAQPCALRPDGFLRGRFFGALSLTADWSGDRLACDGMQKPEGRGVRLYFAGEGPDGGRIALLIGLEGRPEDLPGAERPANVTVIDEREGRFFSTAGTGRCWASIDGVTPLAGTRNRAAGSRIDGLVYCVGALPSVGDHSSLTLGDLHFAGWITAHAD